jgi:transketolase
MTQHEYFEPATLQGIALSCREQVIRMATDGGCFIGASLSCVDILVYLYEHVLRIDPNELDSPDRDYFILSKGHDVPALYAVLAEKGILDRSRLKNHLSSSDDIYWHPNTNVPGVEFHSGSLGHGLAAGMGFAMAQRLSGRSNKVVVLLGDGEMNEGSVWESFLVANAQKLENLIAIVDRNQFQANCRTEDLNPLEPITEKLEAFGWETHRCDGHSFEALHETFSKIAASRSSAPKFIVADTVRGKGLPSIEADATRWFVDFTHGEIHELLQELHTGAVTQLTSDVIIPR